MRLKTQTNYLPVVLAGLLAFAPAGAWPQSSKPLQGVAPVGDPALQRQKNLKELLNQAREELLLNRNPAAAKEKCQQALALDPNNAEAHFFLAQAERQLKGEATMGTRSPVSALPDASKLSEAVARSRPTTTTVVLPSDRSSTAPSLLRRAVVDNKDTYVAPRPTIWIREGVWTWIAFAIAGVVVVGAVAFSGSRFLAAKRRKAALAHSGQAQPTTAPSFESPSGASVLGAAAGEDFPIGDSTMATAPGRVAMPATSPSAGDSTVDFWGASPQHKSAASIMAAVERAASSGKEEEVVDVLPASQVFGDEEFDLGPLKTGAVAQAPSPKAKATTTPTPARPATAAVTSDRPASPTRPAADEDSEPIALDGVSMQSPAFQGFEEPESEQEETRLLQAEQAMDRAGEKARSSAKSEIETTPFSLDLPLDETETSPEEGTGPSRGLDVLEVPEPEEIRSIRLEDDFPLGGPSPPTSPTAITDTAPLGVPDQPRNKVEELPPRSYDEILISPGPRKSDDQGTFLAGQAVSGDSTITDSRANQKALFQDQLARGIAAMEKGAWKDAVKFLSIAHALDPADDYVREKLREAREKRADEPT